MQKVPLIIFGTEDFAEIAYEYFSQDSNYQVVAFTVEKAFMNYTEKFNLPVIPFEEIELKVDPSQHSFFAAATYTNLNDFRSEILLKAKNLGFKPASYISSRSFVWPNVNFGEHCFIFENNTIQPFVSIGNNVIMWSGNHIGHHSRIMDNNFFSSHVVVSGNCLISSNCFFGVNSTISNNISIGARSWVGPGAVLTRNLQAGSLVTNSSAEIKNLDEKLLNEKLKKISKKDLDFID